MLIFIEILLLCFVSSFCYSSDYKQKSIITSYPLSKSLYDDKSVIPIDRVKMNRVVEKISTLRFGDTSSTVVKKIGYQPDEYFISPNKSLVNSSNHLIMNYIFCRQPNRKNKLVMDELSLILIFSKDDKLISVIDNSILGLVEN
ncbi:MAG: hypothetical protein EKK63_16285 [Acinetobacter sp.]|uniref:hypothetical protein n=1 Tax=Acinetobacter sp. TaxID=472 RepID=UPI000FBDB67D|nr:hypothetical protein [Acinetobacter sp.]RUP36875.1 MAG: hypothetical protein EKK63_16285 [Acinetobacter sp.]